MPVFETIDPFAKLSFLRGLRKYSSSEVASNNLACKLFASAPSWKLWIEDALQELLQVPAERTLEIHQSHQLHVEQTHKYTFAMKEITIGRAPDNDISLPLRSISRKHAHIIERQGDFYVEDLESSSGTYVNHQSLEPGQPRRLASGDEVLIFPYLLRVNVQDLWSRDTEVKLTYAARLTPSAPSEFISRLGSDLCLFQLRIHPEMGHAMIALARPFLKTILSRLTQHLISELAEIDSGLIEFLVVSILERANRELRFPFQCALVPGSRFALQDDPGVTLEASVRLAKAQGAILLFLPGTCISRLQTSASAGLPISVRDQLSWQLTVRLGFVVLAAGDLPGLEPGDILLYTPELDLVLPSGAAPHVSESGWRLVRDENSSPRFALREFFERSVHMEDSATLHNETTAAEVGFSSLPIRIHVVLSQIELSLRDLEALTEGSIIQLEQEHLESVQLVANGKVLGAGELVEIDNRLGVQLNQWRKA